MYKQNEIMRAYQGIRGTMPGVGENLDIIEFCSSAEEAYAALIEDAASQQV